MVLSVFDRKEIDKIETGDLIRNKNPTISNKSWWRPNFCVKIRSDWITSLVCLQNLHSINPTQSISSAGCATLRTASTSCSTGGWSCAPCWWVWPRTRRFVIIDGDWLPAGKKAADWTVGHVCRRRWLSRYAAAPSLIHEFFGLLLDSPIIWEQRKPLTPILGRGGQGYPIPPSGDIFLSPTKPCPLPTWPRTGMGGVRGLWGESNRI